MKPFWIVITKATLKSYWYAKYVGRKFRVVGIEAVGDDNAMFVVETRSHSKHFVDWDDCEIADE